MYQLLIYFIQIALLLALWVDYRGYKKTFCLRGPFCITDRLNHVESISALLYPLGIITGQQLGRLL